MCETFSLNQMLHIEILTVEPCMCKIVAWEVGRVSQHEVLGSDQAAIFKNILSVTSATLRKASDTSW